jgi:hypothetical protein
MFFVMAVSICRIKKLFHYRRVSELFHIVQAAYIAKQIAEKDEVKSEDPKNKNIFHKFINCMGE